MVGTSDPCSPMLALRGRYDHGAQVAPIEIGTSTGPGAYPFLLSRPKLIKSTAIYQTEIRAIKPFDVFTEPRTF